LPLQGDSLPFIAVYIHVLCMRFDFAFCVPCTLAYVFERAAIAVAYAFVQFRCW
jgi:hypothetical protein